LRRLWADPAWAGVRFYLLGRDQAQLQALEKMGAAAGIECSSLVLDMLNPASCQTALKWAQTLPPLQGLALVAGMSIDRSISKLDEAEWDAVWQVNVGFHAGLLAGLKIPGRLAPGARGILVGSIVGLRGNHGQTAYAAAKGALIDLLPYCPETFRLNILLPPLVPSPLLANLTPEGHERLFKARLLQDPDPALSCAEAGAFLLSDAAAYMQHQLLHADSRVGVLGLD
jgi:NAD(P)-dependent dehydrogenase (short-subunit alcohol dehydrogenase family)